MSVRRGGWRLTWYRKEGCCSVWSEDRWANGGQDAKGPGDGFRWMTGPQNEQIPFGRAYACALSARRRSREDQRAEDLEGFHPGYREGLDVFILTSFPVQITGLGRLELPLQ